MTFAEFATYLQTLDGISSRLEITGVLAKLFKDLKPTEVQPACNFLLGQLRPAYEGREFQVATKSVIKSLVRLTPAKAAQTQTLFAEPDWSTVELELNQRYQKLGDIGDLAAEVTVSQHPTQQLTLTQVYERLLAIADARGAGSQDQKIQLLSELLQELDGVSAKFVTRMIIGKLRLGFSTMTIIDALSWTMTGSKAERDLLEAAWQKQTDIGHLAELYLSHHREADRQQQLAAYSIEVGVPVTPALCQRLETAAEVIAKMDHVFVEPKYDGVRVQIHYRRATAKQPELIRSFSRSLEVSTEMFPELSQLGEVVNCDECVLDGEAIGFDPTTGKLKPFQETITRKRKHGVAETAAQIPLKFFVFDVLALDGKTLIQEKLQDRKELLKKLFKKNEVFLTTPYELADKPEAVQQLHTQALAEGLEGVVIKQVVSNYQPGRKGWAWVKMKEAEGTRGKLLDTIDAVVMGYYQGRGKRTEFGLGAFLVGVLDAEGQVVTLAKIGTGLSDEQFRTLHTTLKPHQVSTAPAVYQVAKALIPDVWVEPSLVVEVAADELTTSPQHTAGLALRFPRLVRFRPDKKWQDATTLVEVKQLA